MYLSLPLLSVSQVPVQIRELNPWGWYEIFVLFLEPVYLENCSSKLCPRVPNLGIFSSENICKGLYEKKILMAK